jgi:hypothetical protein
MRLVRDELRLFSESGTRVQPKRSVCLAPGFLGVIFALWVKKDYSFDQASR